MVVDAGHGVAGGYLLAHLGDPGQTAADLGGNHGVAGTDDGAGQAHNRTGHAFADICYLNGDRGALRKRWAGQQGQCEQWGG